MDPSVVLMLSNLLNLQNHLDPLLSDTLAAAATTPASPSSPSAPSPSPSTSSPVSANVAPLVFFAIASAISYASSLSTRPRRDRLPRSPSPPPLNFGGLAAFRALANNPSSRMARWRSLYGLPYPAFAALADRLKTHLRRSASVPTSLPPDYALSVALSRLARGLSANAAARAHSLDPAVVARLTNAVTRLITTQLYREYVRPPSEQRSIQAAEEAFRGISSLPGLCGAVGAIPIRLRRAPSGNVTYRCRQGYPAILLQVVADAKKLFWDVCVRAPGSVDEATHFRDSQLCAQLTSGEILHDAIATVRGHPVRPYIAGDGTFPLLPFLMTPFTGDSAGTPAHNVFDAALADARAASLETALGMLRGGWRILRSLNVGVDHAAQTIVACCVLHNMCILSDGLGEDDGKVRPWRDSGEDAAFPTARILNSEKPLHQAAVNLRRALAEDLYERRHRQGRGR